MYHSKKIEIYIILNSDFVTPLANIGDDTSKANFDESQTNVVASYINSDFIFIFDNQVWVRNRRSGVKDDYALAMYSPEFVRLNKMLFEKVL